MPSLDHSAQRVRLFKNEHLEQLTLISPRVFVVAWSLLLPMIGWIGWGAVDFLTGCGLVFAGVVVWTVFEYVMHRYLFHLESEIPMIRGLVFMIHGNHHDDPGDPLRGLMPLPASLPIAGVVWTVFSLSFGLPGTWLFLGFMIGYVMYDGVHYACHQWPMRGPVASAIKRHHMRHHYIDPDANFAISAIFWDRVFGSRIKSLKRDRQDQGQ